MCVYDAFGRVARGCRVRLPEEANQLGPTARALTGAALLETWWFTITLTRLIGNLCT